MPEDTDKYPEATDRRRFVSGVVGGAVLSGLGVTGGATVNAATSPSGAGGGPTQYLGMENTAGPAPRAMPQIPVEVEDGTGYLKGIWPEVKEVQEGGRTFTIAEMELGGVTYSSQWFQYCGVQTYPGVQPEADQDNYLRYASEPPYAWQQEEVSPGDRVNIEHFQDYETWGNDIGDDGLGKPASATWRSQGLSPQETMVVQVIRSTRVEEKAQGDEWLDASTEQGFIANLNKCTHFCCVPSFKGIASSAKFGGENAIYCPCHQSVYDPFSIVRKNFIALPRPED